MTIALGLVVVLLHVLIDRQGPSASKHKLDRVVKRLKKIGKERIYGTRHEGQKNKGPSVVDATDGTPDVVRKSRSPVSDGFAQT